MNDTWDWVRASPLFLLLLTLAAYRVGRELQDRTGGHSLAQPVVVAIGLVGAAITLLDIDYATYADGAFVITFLLGPATVALAVPLHRQARLLTGYVRPLLVAIVAGTLVSLVSAVLLVSVLGGDDLLARTLGPRTATTPVAIAVAETAGGVAPVAAVLAIAAGILGAVAGPTTLDLLRVREPRARGLAVGAVSHGIGTSRMLRESETEGALSGLSMGLSALGVSLLFPLVVAVLL